MSEIGSITFLVSLLDVHYEIHRPLVWSIVKRVVGVLGPRLWLGRRWKQTHKEAERMGHARAQGG